MTSVRLACEAMATRFELVLHGQNPVALRAAGEEALAEIQRWEAQLSLYRPTSEIARLNAHAAHRPVRVEPGLFRLLQHARRLWEETGGAFDITVGPLMHCWGFGNSEGRMPAPEDLEQARTLVGMPLVELNPSTYTVRFLREGVTLDLGAIGKGYALEQAAECLREIGVTSALLHGGTSTIVALGRPPGAESWKIALTHPMRTSLTVSQGEIKAGCPDAPVGTGSLAGQRAEDSARRSSSFPGVPGASDDGTARGETGTKGGREELGHDARLASRVQEAPDASSGWLAVVPLADQSLSVSAVWGKCFHLGNRTYGHVIDPRTGQPTSGARMAAVALPSATETDALATALLTAGIPGHDQIAQLRPEMRTLVLEAADTTTDVRIRSQGITVRQAPAGR